MKMAAGLSLSGSARWSDVGQELVRIFRAEFWDALLPRSSSESERELRPKAGCW